MAERRMFAKTIIDSDAFLDMSQSSQLLYFHLSMRADDDGFINKPKAIMRLTKGNENDIKELISKKFIIPFESGVVVIKHWRIHNYISKDRYNETKYKEEKELLEFDENNSYTLNGIMSNICIQNNDTPSTQVRLGKVRIGKDKNIYGELQNIMLTDDEYNSLINDYSESVIKTYIDKVSCYIPNKKGAPYKDHAAAIRQWLKTDNIQKVKISLKLNYHVDKHCPYCYRIEGKLTELPRNLTDNHACKCGANGKDIREVIMNKKGGA